MTRLRHDLQVERHFCTPSFLSCKRARPLRITYFKGPDKRSTDGKGSALAAPPNTGMIKKDAHVAQI
jgi:hypothetical protein